MFRKQTYISCSFSTIQGKITFTHETNNDEFQLILAMNPARAQIAQLFIATGKGGVPNYLKNWRYL